jgi:hypothetical protein
MDEKQHGAVGGTAFSSLGFVQPRLWAGVHKLLSTGWHAGGATFIATSLGRPGWSDRTAKRIVEAAAERRRHRLMATG